MARYGHKDWIVWTDKAAVQRSERLSRDSMKQCLLDVGTSGGFTEIAASSAHCMRGYWRMGVNILNQFKYGMR